MGPSSVGLSVHGCVRPCDPLVGARERRRERERERREGARAREERQRARLPGVARLAGAMIRIACPRRFGKILVMNPLEWNNMWVSCSGELGEKQRVPRVAKYAKVSSCVPISARGI